MKYFLDREWSESLKYLQGILRPYATIPESLRYKEKNGKYIFYLHKRVPIPWQSIPAFHNNQLLHLNLENEKTAVEQELCPYCGIKINNDEVCTRWTTNDATPTKNGPRVQSDMMPFHLDCMNNGRIFCPYMRGKKNEDFEIGLFKDLIINARENIKKYPPTE